MSRAASIPPTPSSSKPSPAPTSSPVQSLSSWSSTSLTRLQSLYSDFSRQKASNPASFQANVEWWRRALEELVSTGFQDAYNGGKTGKGRLVLHANSSLLEQVKVPKVGKPLALGAVLSDLHTARSFYPLNEFTSLKSSLYSTSSLPVRIASYVVGKPLWWALEQMGITGEEGVLTSHSRAHHHKGTAWHGDYVIVSLVEAAAERVQEAQATYTVHGAAGSLYSMEGFRKAFGSSVLEEDVDEREGVIMGEQDARVILKFLERDLGIVVVDQDVVKFVAGDALPEERVITPVDRGILELKEAVANMHAQVDAVQNKIDQCTKHASEALAKDRKAHALSYIRSRKQLQEVLSKRLWSLATLESTLMTVEAAAQDVEIMKSYESSTVTLKAILSHPSLQRDNVDKTLEALAEANTDAREIDNSIRIAADVALGVDEGINEDEVEAEWEELVKQMSEESETEGVKQKLDAGALNAPTSTPQEKGVERGDQGRTAVLST